MRRLKFLFFTILGLATLIGLIAYVFLASIKPQHTGKVSPYKISVERIGDQPIISTDMHPMLIQEADDFGYKNINGPSLIKVPEWVANPLGKYYLYFAHHKGSFIRLAYSDTITGPWVISNERVLPLAQSGLATRAGTLTDFTTLRKYTSWSETIALLQVSADYKKDYEEKMAKKMVVTKPTEPHLASPDIYIDDKRKEIRMYYHGVVEGSLQMSKVAISKDGINFKPEESIIGLPYLRTFDYDGKVYGLAMPGFLYRSDDGLKNFEVRKQWVFSPTSRHYGLHLEGSDLYIFYSKVGDAPEVIYYTKMDISSKDWNDWIIEPPRELMKPMLKWEGVDLPIVPSSRGESGIEVNELRDPFVFKDEDEQLYLLYTGMGEQHIGIAKIKIIAEQ